MKYLGLVVIKLYLRLLSRCTTINQVNRFVVALGNRLTPKELFELSAELDQLYFSGIGLFRKKSIIRKMEQVERTGFYAIKKMTCHTKTLIKKPPEPYVRVRIKRHFQLFSNRNIPSKKKVLIVGFTGGHKRLMLPISGFLNHISASKYDLILIKDNSRKGYRSGLEGVCTSIDGVIDEVGKVIEKDSYSSVVSMGTSAGGLPAILTAIKLNLDKGVSIGGSSPSDPRWEAVKGFEPNVQLAEGYMRLEKDINILGVYSESIKKDKLGVEGLSKYIPMSLLSVQSVFSDKLEHAFFAELVRQYRFTTFINKVLDPDDKSYGYKEKSKPSKFLVF